MTYDQKSLELAEHFLSPYRAATAAMREELAKDIQRAVEDFIEYGEHADELRRGGTVR